MMTDFDVEYWNNLFKNNKLGWDIGYASPALTEYFDQIENKDIRILIPGAGNAYEAEYLYKNGLKNTFILDFSKEAINSFSQRADFYPKQNIFIQDFFEHNQKYDLIVEQTFFTSFHPSKREKFAKKIADLLNDKGKYVGLFFTHEFHKDLPPFGATKDIYNEFFLKYFDYKTFEIANNSIKPRKWREYFFIMQKKEI